MKRNTQKTESGSAEGGRLCCPQCGARLLYDEARKVLRNAIPGGSAGKEFSLEKAVAELKSEQSRADERFQAAVAAESKRKEALSDLFEKSLKKAGEDPNPPPRPFDFD
jgi:hypothetical protein